MFVQTFLYTSQFSEKKLLRYILAKLLENNKKNEDAATFSRRFNDNQNKGHLYAAGLVERKEIVIELRRNYSS